MRASEFLIEAPIMRPAGSYDPNPNDAYHTATTNTTPKYDVDYEKDYGPGESLGRIPNIQSQTEVIQMPDGDLYLLIKDDMTLSFLDKYFLATFQYLGVLLMSCN